MQEESPSAGLAGTWCETAATCPSAPLRLLTHICSFTHWLMLTSTSSLSLHSLLLSEHAKAWEQTRVSTWKEQPQHHV